MKKLIAVVGMSGSGKSVLTSYLEDKGYKKIYFGGVIYDKMKEEGIEIPFNMLELNIRKVEADLSQFKEPVNQPQLAAVKKEETAA